MSRKIKKKGKNHEKEGGERRGERGRGGAKPGEKREPESKGQEDANIVKGSKRHSTKKESKFHTLILPFIGVTKLSL